MKVAIIGATGYSGVELIRFLHQHPHVSQYSVISTSNTGSEIIEMYPHLIDQCTERLEACDVEKISSEVELVFFATPSGISRTLLPQFLERGVKCIDLSGDFRLLSAEVYEQWYHHEAAEAKYLQQAVYGLSEVYADQIKGADLIANPGCYPTASLLALIPALKGNLIEASSIIIDGKSGVSGAGRKASMGTHFAEVHENIKAYKLGIHQHIPEIEHFLSDACRSEVRISFSTHLIPMTRGIMCTIYCNLMGPISTQEIIQYYQEFYQEHPFVRIRAAGTWPSTKEVYGSNYCDLGFTVDTRTGRLMIVSVIDNLVKGASGQAIQNMNLMFGWNVQTGLTFSPVYP